MFGTFFSQNKQVLIKPGFWRGNPTDVVSTPIAKILNKAFLIMI
jgi:hypothetical protein